jgi:acyl carrier protein
VLEKIPLTPNGKVDRRALPVAERTQAELETSFVAPSNPVEANLVEIWAQVLQKQHVGIHDSFFELGGHSLLATRIVSQVQAEFQVALPLHSLFGMPTVAGMAQEIQRIQAGQPASVAEGDYQIRRADRGEEGEKLVDYLDQLSDAEIDSLLEQVI